MRPRRRPVHTPSGGASRARAGRTAPGSRGATPARGGAARLARPSGGASRPRTRGAALLPVAALALAAPAHAVVGGKKVSAHDTPWFATLNGCGGTLVAPDRIVTAGHCVLAISPAELKGIRVGGVKRNGVRFAMHPEWRRSNGDNVLDDVAIIQLDQPVPNVTPATLGGEAPK